MAKNPKIKALVDKLEDFHKQFQEQSKTIFAEGSKELFNDNPELESFGFSAFTPYFSDGDENIYRVNGDDPDINGVDGYDVYGVEDKNEKAKLEKLQRTVASFINSFPTESIKNIFPDHSKITVYRDGRMEVEDYAHD